MPLKAGAAMRFALYSKKLRPNDHIRGKILTTKRVISAGAINKGPRRSGLSIHARKPAAPRDRTRCACSLIVSEVAKGVIGIARCLSVVSRSPRTLAPILRLGSRPPIERLHFLRAKLLDAAGFAQELVLERRDRIQSLLRRDLTSDGLVDLLLLFGQQREELRNMPDVLLPAIVVEIGAVIR